MNPSAVICRSQKDVCHHPHPPLGADPLAGARAVQGGLPAGTGYPHGPDPSDPGALQNHGASGHRRPGVWQPWRQKRLGSISPELGQAVVALDRQLLHAWRISFIHPATEEPMTMEVPMPSDMTGLIDRFREISSKKRSTEIYSLPMWVRTNRIANRAVTMKVSRASMFNTGLL